MGEALRKWLPRMNQLVKPWMSAEDIGAGSLWFQETAKVLSESQFGITCLTSDNLKEPWIYFESGALFDIVEKQRQRICPYLLDLDPSDIKGPLSHFQAKLATKENTREILNGISELGDETNKGIIMESFERFWPDLEKDFKSINDIGSETKLLEREPRDMLQELLELVREQSHSLLDKQDLSASQKERADIIIKILKEGVYDDSPFSCSSITDPLRKWHNETTKKSLEKELLDMAFGNK